jgi:hypothetical protein
LAKLSIGDKVVNILSEEDGEEDRFVYGVVYDIFFDREGQEVIDVEYPGYHYAETQEEYLRLDTRDRERLV